MTINYLQIQVNMSGKKLVQNLRKKKKKGGGEGLKKSTFNNVCACWFVILSLDIRKNRHSNFTRLRIRVCNEKILFLIFHKENIC